VLLALRRRVPPEAAALAGVAVAAVVLTLVQSYVYSVGNVATVTVWICLMLLFAESDVAKAQAEHA
jgi:hypothetical protein